MKTMLRVRHLALTLCLAVFGILQATGQMKIGNNPTQIHKSSILELESDRQGLLLPRLASFSQINSIITTETNSEINGMIVYYTGSEAGYEGPGFYCYELKPDGVTYGWVKIASAADAANNWGLKGNAGTDDNTNFIGTTDDNDLVFKTQNTERLRIEQGGAIKVASGTIGNGTDEVQVLVLKSDGTILQRALPASVFTSVVKSLNGLTDDISLEPNASTTNTNFSITPDAANKKIILNAPILDATNAQDYGFLSKADWEKLQTLTDANNYSVADYVAAAAAETKRGANLSYDEATHRLTLTLYAADPDHAGIVTETTQEFGGKKTFRDDLAASSQLTVVGSANLNGGATVGTATTNSDLTVNGNTAITGNAAISGNTVLGSNTDGTVTINNLKTYTLSGTETTVPTLVVDGTNQVQKLDLSPAAFKTLKLGNTAGADPSNGGVNGLNFDATTSNLILNVPDAGTGVRGVINTTSQTFQGDKEFSDNVSVAKDLTVTGAGTISGNASVGGTLGATGAATLGSTLEVTGAATFDNAMDVKDNATLEKSVTLTTAPSAATPNASNNFNVLVRNETSGTVEQTTISKDASLPLGIDADPAEKDLYINRKADSILIEVPDAAAEVRGVISTGEQTFAGEKTFAANTTIGDASDATKAANLAVHGAVSMATAVATGTYSFSGNSAKIRTLLVDASGGPVTITLPSGTDLVDGVIYTITITKNPGLNDVSVTGGSFGDGNSTMKFYNAGSSRTIQNKAGTWYIIGQ